MLKLSDMTSHATCGRISVEVEGREEVVTFGFCRGGSVATSVRSFARSS